MKKDFRGLLILFFVNWMAFAPSAPWIPLAITGRKQPYLFLRYLCRILLILTNYLIFIILQYGNNALHLACMSNQPKVLEYILKTVKTFKNDVQNKLGRTALNIAASQGAFECIEILLNNLHCDINSKDKVC